MQMLEIGTNRVLIDFTDSLKLYDLTPRFIDAGSQSYRRGDRKLVSNDSKTYKQAEVDTLEVIYRSREPFICIPDSVDEPEKAYIVRWTSPFDTQDTIKTNWSQGKSLQAVFRQI